MSRGDLVTVSTGLLRSVLKHITDPQLQDQIKQILSVEKNIVSQEISKFPKIAKVKKVIDGDTILLANGLVLRYVGITAPETGEPYEKEATEVNRKLVEGKTVRLVYDNYKSDKFGRLLAYVFIGNTNISEELARLGLAEVVIYQKRKPFIYQAELLKVQDQAKKKILGIWNRYSIPINPVR